MGGQINEDFKPSEGSDSITVKKSGHDTFYPLKDSDASFIAAIN